jgi:hypothetical protein
MASRCHAWVCPVRVNDTRARRDSTAKCALGHAPSLLACPQLARSPLRVPGCVMGCPPITPFCTARSLRTTAATSSPTAGGSEVNRGSSIDGWGRSYKTQRLKKWPSFGPLCRLARRTASQHVLTRTVVECCDVLESERAWRRRRGSSSTTGNEQRRMQRDLVTLMVVVACNDVSECMCAYALFLRAHKDIRAPVILYVTGKNTEKL